MHIARITAAVFLVAAACGTSQTTGDGGTPADGGGVCCAITGGPPCGCASGGGWAPSVDKCPSVGGCDEWFDTTTDSHGCAALVANPSKCCMCPFEAGAKDATSDVANDASTDAPDDVTSQ